MSRSLHRLLGDHTADPIDVVQVEIRAVADSVNLGPHVQVSVKNNAQVAHLISGRKDFPWWAESDCLQHGCQGMVNFPSC